MQKTNTNTVDQHTNTAFNRHSGFALIEVLLAGLVLTIGALAFLKLQTLSLHTSFNDYAKVHGSTFIHNFVEQLRTNRHFINLNLSEKNHYIIGGSVAVVAPPQQQSSCQSESKIDVCASKLLDYQRYLTSQQMQSALPAKNSLLCYREDNNRAGFMRLDFIWLDNSETDKTATLSSSDCPKAFDTSIKESQRNHQVTIYAQL